MNPRRRALLLTASLTASLMMSGMRTALAAEVGVVAAAPSAPASGVSPSKPSIVIDSFSGTGGRDGEPAVQKTVIEGDSERIDELRVRGQLTRIVVTSKNGSGSYEIITGDGSRDLSNGRNTNRGAAGQRVWSVLRF